MTIRSRILLVFLLATVSGFFALERWLSLELRPRYYQSFEEPLVDMANILAELASEAFSRPVPDFRELESAFERVYKRDPKALIYGLRKDAIDVRVYITDLNGKVLFDSYHEAVGQDYSRWRDVHLTLKGEYGVRSSPLTGNFQRKDDREARSIAYVSAPVYRNGDLAGVLSVGKPKVTVTQFILNARQDLVWAVAGVTMLALLTGTLLYLWISRPLYQVAQFAQGIAQGEILATPDLGDNEIGSVARAIAAMRQALDGKHYIEHYTQTLAHELKSPLTSIKASAELLLEEMPEVQRQRFIGNIVRENGRALNLIQRLLELAAVENRQGVVDSKPVPLADVIEEITASAQPALMQNKLTLKIEGDTEAVVNGERFLIKQALFNIVENAIAFSPSGGEITLTVVPLPGKVQISVRDHGPGIPAYAKERIFDRFYSLPRPNGQNRSSGLGLSFVKEVMELHQGSIKLISKEDGTEAVLEIPV